MRRSFLIQKIQVSQFLKQYDFHTVEIRNSWELNYFRTHWVSQYLSVGTVVACRGELTYDDEEESEEDLFVGSLKEIPKLTNATKDTVPIHFYEKKFENGAVRTYNLTNEKDKGCPSPDSPNDHWLSIFH